MEYDFSGWATKNDLRCSDGRIIRHNAFASDDGRKVPLVWNHQHNEPSNILGHAMLENRDEGVYTYGVFNDTAAGQNAKQLLEHGDIESLSIYANQLQQDGPSVMHGTIREVSLVLAGANPGAFIDSVIQHDGYDDREAGVIYTGEQLDWFAHADDEEHDDDEYDEEEYDDEDVDDDDDSDYEDDDSDEYDDDGEELAHADSDDDEDEDEEDEEGETVEDVFETLTDKQKAAVAVIVGEIKNSEGEENMKHNVFDNDTHDQDTLIHDGLQAIVADAKNCGSMRESYLKHAAEYGIDNIDWLFPEYKNINGDGAPGFIKNQPDAWVDTVMNGVHHTPFSRIRMMYADLREDDARAKGYAQKGKLKKEEVFGLLKRKVDPTTVYKKQKLDRDDVVDITDFDVVSFLKGEMRMMLNDELARAFVFGDGRSTLDEDKISETNIIPICKDASLFNIEYTVTVGAGESLGKALVTAAVKSQDNYEGSGNLTAFLPNTVVTDMLLLEDTQGHRLYKDMRELALAMSVDKIVKVPGSIVPSDIYGVIVDLKDYNVGADKGGAVNMFDDFDIDYNQMKYLIETRCSACLIKPFSAITLKRA